MKILCITRLFSGLETSLINQKWQPTGVPTIFKMFEKFDKDCSEVHFILTQKDGFTQWGEQTIKNVKLEGMTNSFTVLPKTHRLYSFLPSKLNKLARELFHLFAGIYYTLKYSPDLVYVDHANTFVAAILKKIFKKKIVYRVMGVYPAMRNALKSERLVDKLMASCYRQPYDLIVCTQDGSGIEPWLNTAVNTKTPVHSFINGVDVDNIPKANESLLSPNAKNRFKILFVGKIENAKGAMEFINVFKKCLTLRPGAFHAVMVGSGSLAEAIKVDLEKNGYLDHVDLIAKLPHSKILQMHKECDVYISLNKLGSLSVANLEAFKVGQCTLIPNSQPNDGIDIFTDSFIPQDMIVKFSCSENIDEIATCLVELESNRDKVLEIKTKMGTWAKSNIPNWEQRVTSEWTLLKELAHD